MTSKNLISSLVFVCAILIASTPLALAQDTSKLVYDRCSVCHNQSRWDGKKKTEKEWAQLVDKMVRWGAELTPSESDLVVNYLTAAGNGKIKQPTTTTTVVRKPQPTTTTTKAVDNIKSIKTTTTSDPQAAPTTTTTLLPVTTTTTLLKQQAKTGVEMIWYLLGGGTLIGSGLKLRNKDTQLDEDE
jgi:hypothetical protein